jgi:hypothetical protein
VDQSAGLLAAVALPAKTVLFGQGFTRVRRLAGEAEIAATAPARVVVLAVDDLLAMHLRVIRALELGHPPPPCPAPAPRHRHRGGRETACAASPARPGGGRPARPGDGPAGARPGDDPLTS